MAWSFMRPGYVITYMPRSEGKGRKPKTRGFDIMAYNMPVTLHERAHNEPCRLIPDFRDS